MSRSKTRSTPTKIIAFVFVVLLGLSSPNPRYVSGTVIGGSNFSTQNVGPRNDYTAAAEMLERAINREMSDKDLPAVSIALVDDDQIVWAKGFGFADPWQ